LGHPVFVWGAEIYAGSEKYPVQIARTHGNNEVKTAYLNIDTSSGKLGYNHMSEITFQNWSCFGHNITTNELMDYNLTGVMDSISAQFFPMCSLDR